jgi:PKD repeat protein
MTAIGHITGSTPYTWTWYYANATWSTGVTNSPLITTSHTYTWCGDYAVSLVVSDSVGCILTDRYRRRNTFLRYERAL